MNRAILDHLTKRYDDVAAVDGVTLEIRAQELTVVLGPSGAGKTTLARLIAGLETPDSGEIYLDGRVIHRLPPQERKVGMVFQQDTLWPHMSVAENVGYSLKLQDLTRRERKQRIGEALSSAGIDSLAHDRCEKLTPLQRQRTALARALALHPDLLILDEPLGRLLGRQRDEFRSQIRALHDEGDITTLILTCDPAEALAYADTLAVLDLGKLVQVGPPEHIYNAPVDAFIAQFLGPVNLLQGQIESQEDKNLYLVKTPIGRLAGRCASGFPALGAPVTIAIRPESLELAPGDPEGSNRFFATLERQLFRGPLREWHLRGPGGWPVMVSALQSQAPHITPDQPIPLSVTPEHVMILPGRSRTPRITEISAAPSPVAMNPQLAPVAVNPTPTPTPTPTAPETDASEPAVAPIPKD